MKRRLITGERIMYVDARTPVNCVLTVTLRGRIDGERVRAALGRIQAKHAMLRAGIREDGSGMPWFVHDEHTGEIPLEVVERRSGEDWIERSKAEWKRRFDIRQGPLARVVWLRSPEVSELMLVCAHCISDGATLINLMQELLLLTDQPERDIGSSRPFQRVEELIPAALLSDKKKAVKGRLFSVLARMWLSCRLLGRSQDPGGGDYLLRIKLGREESAGIMARCRAERVSLHAVMSAAILEAVCRIRGRKARNQLICPVDIRRYIREIKNDTMFAFAPVVHLSLDKDTGADFWSRARKLKEDLSRKVSELDAPAMLLFGEYMHRAVPKMVRYLRSARGTHDLVFSNLGRLQMQESYHTFRLEDVYSPMVVFPWKNPAVIVTSTFAGQIDLAFLSREDFIPEQEAKAIREKAVEILLKETSVTRNQPSDRVASG